MIDDTTPDRDDHEPTSDEEASDDRANTSPASTGHSNADSQTRRNVEDESPS